MKVYEIRLQVYLLKDIKVSEAQEKILKLIDNILGKDETTLKFHNTNEFKNYCFNSFYPIEKDGIYKDGTIYTIIIRTIDKFLATYFNKNLSFSYTSSIKALKTSMRILPLRKITRLYSITPVIIKTDNGYWKNVINFSDYENRIKVNLIKKYNNTFKTNIDENFQLYSSLQIKNFTPIAVEYKHRKLLGDKLSLDICDNEFAQKLAYMALGTGLGEMNARGLGFVGYKISP